MKSTILAVVLLAIAAVAIVQSQTSAVIERGEAAFKNNGCYGCHIVGKAGTPIGPDLTLVGRKYPVEYFVRWLRDPALQRPNAHMPALELTEADVQALAAYLGSLR
jgi:mono/diheme cytochrome c family protein